MNDNNESIGADSPLSLLGQALQRASSSRKHKRDADFAEAFPTIEQYLASKTPQKTVLEEFNSAYGHTIHPPRFRKMLEDERTRREQAGDVVPCYGCGRALLGEAVFSTADNKIERQGGEA